MRSLFIFLVLLISCSSTHPDDEISSDVKAYNGNPPPPLVCKHNEMVCFGKCIDVSSNNSNCGSCDEKCNIAVGDFCTAYRCVNVRVFGFDIGPAGPNRYDIRKDLPRPIPIKENR